MPNSEQRDQTENRDQQKTMYKISGTREQLRVPLAPDSHLLCKVQTCRRVRLDTSFSEFIVGKSIDVPAINPMYTLDFARLNISMFYCMILIKYSKYTSKCPSVNFP